MAKTLVLSDDEFKELRDLLFLAYRALKLRANLQRSVNKVRLFKEKADKCWKWWERLEAMG